MLGLISFGQQYGLGSKCQARNGSTGYQRFTVNPTPAWSRCVSSPAFRVVS